MLSMRSIWQFPLGGLAPGLFDSWQQAVVFPKFYCSPLNI